ncbi:MAG: ATP-dependent DNA helicase RecG [Phycisphaerae bacterium]
MQQGVRRIALTDSIQFVRGVGPYRAGLFSKLGIDTVGDLLSHYPFRYEVRPPSVPINRVRQGEVCTIVGEVKSPRLGRNGLFRATIQDGTGHCAVRWFNSSFLRDRLVPGVVVRLSGKVGVEKNTATLTNPATETFADGEDPLEGDETSFLPIYSGTAELDSRQIAKTIERVLPAAIGSVREWLPASLQTRHDLMGLRDAIVAIHTAPGDVHPGDARRRLAYDEFLLSQLGLRMARNHTASVAPGIALRCNDQIDRRIRLRLPFELSAGQDAVVKEIVGDLQSATPMNRLLQGDVGAGKTAVAVYASLVAVASRTQVALLAPTEVLARQHFNKFRQYLEGSEVRCELLVGATPVSDRRRLFAACSAGEVDLLLGTHAILEQDVSFRRLGLVVIDEQHKFGVRQRALLRWKGTAPHVLVMTATPIPRTLAMTVFGDLDVSIIRGVLPGRQPIETTLVAGDQSDAAWGQVRSALQRREQAYVVYPLVEESENLDWKAATVEANRLSQQELKGFRVGLLHGRMSSAEKKEVMDAFVAHAIDVLVSTTVIEVGVDVGNATVMVIQHAQRYGLSQLHQLRGRVGRGSRPSQCFLFYESEKGAVPERLKVVSDTLDGFRIAEEDLRIRGPGELLGTRQHGMPRFKAGDVVSDVDLLQAARDDAAELLRSDEGLAKREHRSLREAVLHRYGRALGLIDVA